MVRDTIKSMTPKGTFGHVYNITSGLVIITMCIGWYPIPVMVWSFSSIPILQYTVTGQYTILTDSILLCLVW